MNHGFHALVQRFSDSAVQVRGKVVVRKNCEGVVQGPSLNHPTERLNVLFKARAAPELSGGVWSISLLRRWTARKDEIKRQGPSTCFPLRQWHTLIWLDFTLSSFEFSRRVLDR